MAKKQDRPAVRGDALVKVDAELKRRYDRLLAVVRACVREGASAFDALWETVAAIVEHQPPLYVIGGFKNDAEFFREVLHEDRRNAYRMIRVAKFASPIEEQRYGTAKLDAALAHIEAKLGKPLSHPPLPVALERLRFEVKRADGEKRRLGIDEVTRDEIVAATRRLTGKKSTTKASAEELAVKAALKRVKALSAVEVRVRGATASFSNVPLASLPQLARALLAVKPRASDHRGG